MKKISSKIFETIFLQNLWNNFLSKSLKLISSNIFERFFFKIFQTIFLQNLWNYFPLKPLKQIRGVNQWEAGIWSCALRANDLTFPVSLKSTAPSRSPSPAVLDIALIYRHFVFSLRSQSSPAKSVCAADRLQSADRSGVRILCQDAPVSCRQMAPLKKVRELNVSKWSPFRLFVEPNLD